MLFTGIAVAFAFRVGLFNIGAEGQYIVGTILAVIVGYSLDLPPVLQIPVVVLVGTAGGAGIGAIIGWLKLSLASTRLLPALCLTGSASTSATLWFLFHSSTSQTQLLRTLLTSLATPHCSMA